MRTRDAGPATDLLLIAYVFPPYPGVAGRRWAKFAKALSARGHRIHVVHAANPFREISLWWEDVVENPWIRRHEIPARYPAALVEKRAPKTLMRKLEYKMWDRALRLWASGNPYERGLFWRRPMLRAASEILRRFEVRHVIVTGGPFHPMVDALELKRRFPFVRLIADFRDPWVEDLEMVGLSDRRLRRERELEKVAVLGADTVVTVNEAMTESLRARHAESRARFLTIPNGFDEADLPEKSEGEIHPKVFRIILSGTVPFDAGDLVFPFLEMLKRFKVSDPDLYRKLSFELVGWWDSRFGEFVRNEEIDILSIRPDAKPGEFLQKVGRAHLGLVFLQDCRTYALTTKIVEYLGCRRKVLAVSRPGDLGRYLVANDIGYACDPETLERDFRRAVADLETRGVVWNERFDVNQFALSNLAARMESCLANPAGSG